MLHTSLTDARICETHMLQSFSVGNRERDDSKKNVNIHGFICMYVSDKRLENLGEKATDTVTLKMKKIVRIINISQEKVILQEL